MSGESDEFRELKRRPSESPDEWSARLCESLHEHPRSVSDFTRALPELLQDPDVLLDLIALHRRLRVDAGELPQTEEYTAPFPDLADAIREQFVIEELIDPEATGSYHPVDDGDSPPALPPRFVFVRWLGFGGYGRVCECLDTRHANRRVAVKLLNEFRSSTVDAARFRREAELIATLNHPNLCTLYEFDFEHEPPFLVLELIDGETVFDMIAGEQLSIRETARIARDAAAALSHCHANGVVHRDLKPENIKQRPDGVVKVLDLGLARSLVPVEGAWTSDERMMVGTVPYFSPEHISGNPGPASDQFSLGITLYEMLTGVRPFVSETVQGMFFKISTETPKSPRDIRPEVDPALGSIVMKMLAKKPEERFPSMAAVRDELNRYLMDVVQAPRRWWIPATILALLLGGGFVWWQLAPQANQTWVDTQQPQDLAGVLRRIAADLASTPAADQEFQRYFRLGHLESGERMVTRENLAVLLPKLAPNGEAVPLKDVNGDGTLLRLDVRALGWTPDREWEAVVRRCPMSLKYAGPDFDAAGGTIKKLLNSDLTPFVLADWFAAAASSEPLVADLVSEESVRKDVMNNERLKAWRQSYEQAEVDLRSAAAELGLNTPEPLQSMLLAKEQWAEELGLTPWLRGGTVPRVEWNRVDIDCCPAAEAATELKLGIRRLVR